MDLDAIFADLAIEGDQDDAIIPKSQMTSAQQAKAIAKKKEEASLSILATVGEQDYGDNGFKIKLSPIKFIELWVPFRASWRPGYPKPIKSMNSLM